MQSTKIVNGNRWRMIWPVLGFHYCTSIEKHDTENSQKQRKEIWSMQNSSDRRSSTDPYAVYYLSWTICWMKERRIFKRFRMLDWGRTWYFLRKRWRYLPYTSCSSMACSQPHQTCEVIKGWIGVIPNVKSYSSQIIWCGNLKYRQEEKGKRMWEQQPWECKWYWTDYLKDKTKSRAWKQKMNPVDREPQAWIAEPH